MQDFFFYIIAIGMVITALGVVTARNILHAALFLIATFYGTVVLYLMLKAEFVALTQMVVYIGGIVIVVVFTILLTSRLGEEHRAPSFLRKLIAATLSGSFLALFARVLLDQRYMLNARTGSTEEFAALDVLGRRLLMASAEGFLLPFEIISLLLLTAIVGALVLAERPGPGKSRTEERP